MSKAIGARAAEAVEPVSGTLGLMGHPLELAAGRPDDIGVDPLEGGTHLRLAGVAEDMRLRSL